jgi:acyl-homoserine lactone synthase
MFIKTKNMVPGVGTMFQVHAIEQSNRHAYAELLEQMYRLRYEIYVQERGWQQLDRPDKREKDDFDTQDAVYLLGIIKGQGVVAGSRLVPTTCPHLLSDVFPILVEGQIPRAPQIFEWTRIFVRKDLREDGRPSKAAGIVYCAIVEYCLRHGISHLTVVCEQFWKQRLDHLGWRPRQLGKTVLWDGELLVGLMVEMSTEALATTRERYEIFHSCLVEQTI